MLSATMSVADSTIGITRLSYGPSSLFLQRQRRTSHDERVSGAHEGGHETDQRGRLRRASPVAPRSDVWNILLVRKR